MKRLLDWLLGKRPQPALSMADALDISLRRGYHAVDWRTVA